MVTLRSLRRARDDDDELELEDEEDEAPGGLPGPRGTPLGPVVDWPLLAPLPLLLKIEPLDVEAAAEEATEASLSLLDSPGDTLRFLRFLRGRPFSFGAGKGNVEH